MNISERKRQKMEIKVNLAVSFVLLVVFGVCAGNLLPERTSSVIHPRRHSQVRNLLDLPSWVFEEDFVLVDYLADGEMERRISYNGITGKETSLGYNTSKSLTLWQVSNNIGFIQLIYSNDGDLLDCEHVHQKDLVDDFLHKFYHQVDSARQRNFTSPYVAHKWSPMTSNHEFRRYIEDDIIPNDFYDIPDTTPFNDAFGMRNLTYNKIENGDQVPEDLRRWLNYNELKEQCHQKHREMKLLVQGLNSKDEEIRRNSTEHIERKKRDLSDWLIAPNTKWCGRGHSAGRYSQLGGASRADKCCRKHDHCRVNIPGLTTKWQLFNFRLFTLSHCNCDSRFRTCLKMADSPDANMIGRIFFNVVQTKCFVLKPEKVCKHRSWWGKCEKKILRKRAHIRDNRKF